MFANLKNPILCLDFSICMQFDTNCMQYYKGVIVWKHERSFPTLKSFFLGICLENSSLQKKVSTTSGHPKMPLSSCDFLTFWLLFLIQYSLVALLTNSEFGTKTRVWNVCLWPVPLIFFPSYTAPSNLDPFAFDCLFANVHWFFFLKTRSVNFSTQTSFFVTASST